MNVVCLKNLTADHLFNVLQLRREWKLHLQKLNWEPRDTSPFLQPSSTRAQLRTESDLCWWNYRKKFSTDVRINMRKNGEISVPRWSVSLKRRWRRRKWAPCSPGSNAELELKALRCWYRLSWMNTAESDVVSLLTNYLSWFELGVLYGKHGVPRTICWTCSHNSSIASKCCW